MFSQHSPDHSAILHVILHAKMNDHRRAELVDALQQKGTHTQNIQAFEGTCGKETSLEEDKW